MATIIEGLKYTKTHEWVKEENGICEIGITDFAQHSLGDLVFIDLPEVGDEITAGEGFADVESVKAVSEVYSPVSGKVIEINEALMDAPESVNDDAFAAWFVKVEAVTDTVELIDCAAYEAVCAAEEV